jgi:SPP1 gp7 family putative phage head morphogenesis protein
MVNDINYKKAYGKAMAKPLNDFFQQFIYAPIIEVLREADQSVKLNAADPEDLHLMKKIQRGDILYDGEFMLGKFDAKTAKQIRGMGGMWDAGKKGYRLSPGKLTPNIKTAISSSKSRLEQINNGLDNVLNKSEEEIDEAIKQIDLDAPLDTIISGMQTQTRRAMDDIGVKYTLTYDQKQNIKKGYTENMEKYIKDWTEEHIKNLRADVQKNSMEGYRFTKLKDTLEHRYGTSKSKAEFLAQQETSLFMAKFRQQRFMEAGVNFYTWQTVGDQKVRDDHRRLNKRIFQFGDPPVVDVSTGRRGEPGEDFRCRCIARPETKKVHKVGGEWKVID